MHRSLQFYAHLCVIYVSHPVSQLGVMTYIDMTSQSPETQAAVEHEVRVLLKVCVIFFKDR